jgi:hypothetical protein
MVPVLVIVGLVGVVVFLASKRQEAESAQQQAGMGTLPPNTSVPYLGAAINSPATAGGSLSASTLYQSQSRTFAGQVATPGGVVPGTITGQPVGPMPSPDVLAARHSQSLATAPGTTVVNTTPVPPTTTGSVSTNLLDAFRRTRGPIDRV